MTDTPAQQFTAIVKKGVDAVTPNTRVAIPAIMLLGAAWWVLDTVRQRDLDRIAAETTAIRKEVHDAASTALGAQQRADDLLLRITRSELTQQHTGQSLVEMKEDIKGILIEIRQMRQEARP